MNKDKLSYQRIQAFIKIGGKGVYLTIFELTFNLTLRDVDILWHFELVVAIVNTVASEGHLKANVIVQEGFVRSILRVILYDQQNEGVFLKG